jgi:hypothetical protein
MFSGNTRHLLCTCHYFLERMARSKREYASSFKVMAPAAQCYAILFTVFTVVFVVKIMN